MKENCTPDDVMQNWSKAVLKKILNESIEYILEDQFNQILAQSCFLQNTKKLASQVSINKKGEITTAFEFDTNKYQGWIQDLIGGPDRDRPKLLMVCSSIV